jgi:hypothetical protein
MLKRIVTNPWLNFAVGLILMLSGFAEVFAGASELSLETVGAHHGATLYGLLHTLKSLAEGLHAANALELEQEIKTEQKLS